MLPRCPRNDCDSHLFRINEFEPIGSAFRLMAICCAKCGAVVGVQETHNTGAMLRQIAKKIGLDLK